MRTKTIKNNSYNDLPENFFEERIYKLRKKAGYSQEKMGELLGIDGKAYGKYEQGTCVPGVERLTDIADVFNVSLDYLWLGTTTSHNERISSILSNYDETVQANILNIVESILAISNNINTPIKR